MQVERGEVVVARSSGGLVAALLGPHEQRDSLWIGWAGELATLSPEQRTTAETRLAELRAAPVHVPAGEFNRFYDGFSNGVLWPLFHYLLDKVDLDARSDWEAYRAVNERFAAAVTASALPSDLIWVQDYQLALVPGLVRRRLPNAAIGFFLHVPFPSPEVFRILPWRAEILRGMLGADRIGFHTAAYRANFVLAAAHVLGTEPDEETIEFEGRRVALGVHPIGIDVDRFTALAADSTVLAEAQRIRDQAGGRRIVLGIDRLDYTKGIPRRLLAIERFLEREPSLRGQVRFIQLAVPTRERVVAYADYRNLVNALVGRLNGQFGSVDAMPIHFLHRSLSMPQVAALYAAADVMIVTPLRDGMNLVAKEFVAMRPDGTGALVLSEFAGAAAELVEAIQVNPYDIEQVASAIARALRMPPAARKLRMDAMRQRVITNGAQAWADGFLADLDNATPLSASTRRPGQPPSLPTEVALQVTAAERVTLLLDFDGTLVSITASPGLTVVDDDLRALLHGLAARAGVAVHIVSGRRRDELNARLAEFPIGLHAEHGFWSRQADAPTWTSNDTLDLSWMESVRSLFSQASKRTSGCFVEQKTASIAWHYRAADPDLARTRVRELRVALEVALQGNEAVEILEGAKLLEVRPRAVHKGTVVPAILQTAPSNSVIVAIGDDRTDEDLFRALPDGAITIRVGPGRSMAKYSLEDIAAVRRLLRGIVDG